MLQGLLQVAVAMMVMLAELVEVVSLDLGRVKEKEDYFCMKEWIQEGV